MFNGHYLKVFCCQYEINILLFDCSYFTTAIAQQNFLEKTHIGSMQFVSRWTLERKLADADVTEEEQNNLIKDLERKETEYMRLQRHKMGVDDFELLTIIGRGAFGEVGVSKNWLLVSVSSYPCKLVKLQLSCSHLQLDSECHSPFQYLLLLQVRLCREKTTGTVYAMKKLKKSEMLRRGQVIVCSCICNRMHQRVANLLPLCNL